MMRFQINNWKLGLITIILTVLLTGINLSAETLAYWRLEQGPNGSTHSTDLDGYFVDTSGNGNNMSGWYYPAPVSDVVFPTMPQTGATNERALSFLPKELYNQTPPNGQYLETDGAPLEYHPFTNAFTIECIAKVRTYNWMVVLGKDGRVNPSAPQPPFKLLFTYDYPEPKILFEYMDISTNLNLVISPLTYELDKWYCIAIVCDGNNATLYIKEESDAYYEIAGTIPVSGGIINSTGQWSVARGMWEGHKANNIYGSVDEVRICDYALDSDQFLAASGGAVVNPVAYWRFEEGTNGVHQGNLDGYYKDSSGNGNDLSTDISPDRSVASDDVPFATVPQILEPDTMSRTFTGNPEITDNNVGTFGTQTSPKPIESAHLTSFTVECMANPSAVSWMSAVSKDGEPGWKNYNYFDQCFAIKFGDDSMIKFLFWDANTNFVFLSSTSLYETGKWYQIAAVYNAGQASLYIKKEGDTNYILEASTTTCVTPGSPAISGGLINQAYPWTIGRGMFFGISRDAFQGKVDEVRISDEGLDISQFLGNIMNTNPMMPEISGVQYSPFPDPDQKDIVTVQAIITAANSTITNATLQYRINGGGFVDLLMTTNTVADIYYGNIISQAIDSVVNFKVKAVNAAGQSSTSDVYQYTVKEEILWATMIITSNCVPYNANVVSMDVAPNGLAGFVYREGNIGARYIEESSLGVMKPPVEISTNLQGSVSNIRFGSDNEPRVSLSYDVNDYGGVTYVQRNSGIWTDPIMVVTNFFDEKRHVMTLVDNAPTILWYQNYEAGGYLGLLCSGNAAGNAFSYADVSVPPFPNIPGGYRRPFAIQTGTNGLRHIAFSGPASSVGGGDYIDLLYYSVETAKGSGGFNWEEVPIALTHSNVYSDQIGFALDNNNNPYIVLRDYNVIPNCATLYYKNSGTWAKKYLSPQGHWNRAAVAYDPYNDCMWAVHNGANAYDDGVFLIHLWSNRSGNWKEEQTINNGDFVESFGGFDFTEDGVMKLAYTPFVESTNYVYMYSTTFSDIPEPSILFTVSGLFFLISRFIFRSQK